MNEEENPLGHIIEQAPQKKKNTGWWIIAMLTTIVFIAWMSYTMGAMYSCEAGGGILTNDYKCVGVTKEVCVDSRGKITDANNAALVDFDQINPAVQ